MTTAVYPGSFNPWHKGHVDILDKALGCFDKIIIAVGHNPEKTLSLEVDKIVSNIKRSLSYEEDLVEVCSFDGFLVDLVKNKDIDVVVRGLRNGHDLQYEMNQQYWNEDLGLEVPVVYFICDRTLSHISSSTTRMVKSLLDYKAFKE